MKVAVFDGCDFKVGSSMQIKVLLQVSATSREQFLSIKLCREGSIMYMRWP